MPLGSFLARMTGSKGSKGGDYDYDLLVLAERVLHEIHMQNSNFGRRLKGTTRSAYRAACKAQTYLCMPRY